MSTSLSAKTFDRSFWLGVGAVVIVIVGAIVTYFLLSKPLVSPLSESITAELPFSPFVVSADSKVASTSKYELTTTEENEKMLSYEVAFAGTTVVVSQYPQPPQFTDIPEYKDRFLDNIVKQYATVQTSNGVIYLGKMTKQNDRPLGIMLERGLIVFMNPERELTQPEWRQLGDLLELQKITH